MNKTELIFVYNADSGMLNSFIDAMHKIISPSTYQCQLCTLTYNNFFIKKDWQAFIKTISADVHFLYKNEFAKQYNVQAELPAVFIKTDESIALFIEVKEIKNCQSLEDLQQLISSKLRKHD